MNNEQRRNFPVFGIITLIIVTAAFLSAIVFVLKDTLPSKEPVKKETIEEEVESKIEEFGYGVVTGSLSYPSEFIPADMEVCAEDINGEKILCTNEHVRGESFTYGIGYALTLPAGEYYIYAHVPNQVDMKGESYKAYFSEFVTCGLSVECSDHSPIKVVVVQGETISSVDPQDWYK